MLHKLKKKIKIAKFVQRAQIIYHIIEKYSEIRIVSAEYAICSKHYHALTIENQLCIKK